MRRYICRFGDGSLREVAVISTTEKDAKIIWNESHDHGGVKGMEEIVPLSWLYVPMVSS